MIHDHSNWSEIDGIDIPIGVFSIALEHRHDRIRIPIRSLSREF